MSGFFGTKDVKLMRGASLAPVPSTAAALADKKYVLVYFSAHWCPPCRAFTPKLKAFYEKHHQAKNFEIVFVTLDNSPEEMAAYMETAHGDWLAMAIEDAHPIASKWASLYHFDTIPALLVFEKRDGTGEEEAGRCLITKSGRDMVDLDPDAATFPWHNSEAVMQAHKKRLMRNILISIGIALVVGYPLRRFF